MVARICEKPFLKDKGTFRKLNIVIKSKGWCHLKLNDWNRLKLTTA